MSLRTSDRFDRLDRRITAWMAAHGLLVLRLALGSIFLWFGALKLVPGLSPAENLAGLTIERLSLGFVSASVAVPILAVWECAIGIGLLTGLWMRATLLLLFVQMLGTLAPLLLFPAETFTPLSLRAHPRGSVHHQECGPDRRSRCIGCHRARRRAEP